MGQEVSALSFGPPSSLVCAERKTTESEGGRPAGALAQAREDLAERKTQLKKLENEASDWRVKLAAAKPEEREGIKEAIAELKEQQDRVEKQIKELRAEIRELGERGAALVRLSDVASWLQNWARLAPPWLVWLPFSFSATPDVCR